MLLYEGKGKSKVLIKFLLNFRQSGDVLFFLNVRRLRGYTATDMYSLSESSSIKFMANFIITEVRKLKVGQLSLRNKIFQLKTKKKFNCVCALFEYHLWDISGLIALLLVIISSGRRHGHRHLRSYQRAGAP